MLYVIRHGQTDWNKEGRIQGQVNVPLNEVGEAQARAAHEEIKDKKFDAVFCSPLLRTKQTCQIAYGGDGVIFDDRLMERDFGANEGVKRAEVDFEAFWTEGSKENTECGETIAQMTDRVVDFLDMLCRDYKDKDVLAVTHGGVIMIINAYFHGLPKDNNFLNYLVSNGAVSQFKFKRD